MTYHEPERVDGGIIIGGACLLVVAAIAGIIALGLALLMTIDAGAASVTMAPGYIEAASCAEIAVMPIINWTAKGAVEYVELRQQGDCRLVATWNTSRLGTYCTGIGTLDHADWIPDICVEVGGVLYLPMVMP